MSARLSDPLVVTTRDAGSWWKRAVDAEGHGLYAKADCTDMCPELRSIRELAVFGLTSMPVYALSVPGGSALQRDVEDELTGARLSLFEEEQENARLLDERHTTNEALADVTEALRAAEARVAELEALTPAPIQTCRTCGAGYTCGEPCQTCMFRARMAAELQARRPEGEHYAATHHDYRVGHDLPETGGGA